MFIKKLVLKNKDKTTRTYFQLVESFRVEEKIRQRVLFHLGRSDTREGQDRLNEIAQSMLQLCNQSTLVPRVEDLQAECSLMYGPTLIFKKLWKDLYFEQIFQNQFKFIAVEFDLKEAIFNMVLNRLTDPSSKRHLALWEQGIYGIQNFEHQHYYRAMDYLIAHKEKIEQSIFGNMRDLFCQNVDVVLFDTTSLIYYGEGELETSPEPTDGKKIKPLFARGFSKDHRSDFKQIIVGVLMSKEGIPLAHEVFPGNTNDVSCFHQVIDKLADKFKIDKIILVGDRGMISQKNLDYLHKKSYQYILGYRMRTIPKKERYWVLSKADLKKVRKDLHWKEVICNDQRLLVCYNPDRAELDAKRREDILDRIKKKIKDGSILSVIDNANYKKFLKIRGDKPKLDPEQIERDKNYDGLYVLTSNTKLSGKQIIDSYKDLWQVEHAFRQLKTELETGPIYHWKDDRIRAHVMICFMAFVLRTVFYKKIKKEKQTAGFTEVMQDLKQLHAVKIKLKTQTLTLRTELKEGASLAFKSIGLKIPNRILQNQSPQM
jgi:transposase